MAGAEGVVGLLLCCGVAAPGVYAGRILLKERRVPEGQLILADGRGEADPPRPPRKAGALVSERNECLLSGCGLGHSGATVLPPKLESKLEPGEPDFEATGNPLRAGVVGHAL